MDYLSYVFINHFPLFHILKAVTFVLTKTTFAPSNYSFRSKSRLLQFEISIKRALVPVSSAASRTECKNIPTSTGQLFN